MEKKFKEDEQNPIWDKIKKVIDSDEEADKKENKEFIFSKYKVPLIKIKKEKEENKKIKLKKKENLVNKNKVKKKLPFFSKERIYERDLKIMASQGVVKFLNKYNKSEKLEGKKPKLVKKKKRITKRKRKNVEDTKVFE
jgi:hypothetical protein